LHRAQDTRGGQVYSRFLAGSAKINLRILVWGPSPNSNRPLAGKREEIRERLRALGHTVHFSEELGFPPDSDIGTNVQELAQLEDVDFVINMSDGEAYGAVGELHEFGFLLDDTILIWLPETARGGFTAGSFRAGMRKVGNHPVFFRPEDIGSCLMAVASCDWVEQWRSRIWEIESRRKALDRLDPRKKQ
jgi:hypothetical protein